MLAPLLVTVVLAAPAASADPYVWLEALDSPKAMEWVKAHNETTVKTFEADARFKTLADEAVAILGAKDRIPQPSFLHGALYNFWQDAEHLRGLWRKTSLEDYRGAQPHWQTVLDIDALNKAEGKSWVYQGVVCLQPEETRCLVSLSDGGEDAKVVREFDLDAGAFVEGGFTLPRGKHRTAWEDQDTLLIATEWKPGELTTSGYPFVVKRLKRGQPLSAAVEVFRGSKTDGGYGVAPLVLRDGQGRTLVALERPLDTFRHEFYVVDGKRVQKLAMPAKVQVADLVAGRVLFQLDEAWSVGGRRFEAGGLVSTELDATKKTPGALKPALVWAPGPKEALHGIATTKDKLVVSVLNNVQGSALVFDATKDGWAMKALELPKNVSVALGATDSVSNRAFVTVSGFLTPSTLEFVDLDTAQAPTAIKTLPAKFDASKHVVEQREATSTDGTKIPYFVVRPKDAPLDGSTPTLLSAYGGFMASSTPSYQPLTGKLWLERGGAYVLANIRGGGEFGPKWHEAGLSTKRQIIYDDFAAVAGDLVASKLTSPRRLGIQGGSNGGLLMGVELVQHPELWNAVIIAVPLLDMIRISKIAAGASWQGEYGDVNADPKVMAFWQKTSPYQNLKSGAKYPQPFIWTTTRDDRVGPQHARKFAARMEEYQLPFYFYENTEGGHGSGADLAQRSRVEALTMSYLLQKLRD
jgi:prolyl oligopeptidase